MKITLDTNALDSDKSDLIENALSLQFDVAVTSVTERERKRPDLVARVRITPEIFITDESPLSVGALGSDDDATIFEDLLKVISHGGFPAKGKRANLTPGEKTQLRDAMAFTSHVRDVRDIFVSDDLSGFINHGRREYLEATYQTRVMSIEEFRTYLENVKNGTA